VALCCRHVQRSVWAGVPDAVSSVTGVRPVAYEVDERGEELVGILDLGEVPGPRDEDELCVGQLAFAHA
jgi:hypothetical protein